MTVSSFTTMGHVSTGAAPWNVDLKTSVPRGAVICCAIARPEGEPVASTTRRERICPARAARASQRSCDARFVREAQLVRVLADHDNAQAGSTQHPRDQLRKLAVAEDARFPVRADIHLFENFAGGSERFREHGSFIRYAGGHAAQIHDRQREVFGECPVMANDSQHAAALAMRGDSPPAIFAGFSQYQARRRKC